MVQVMRGQLVMYYNFPSPVEVSFPSVPGDRAFSGWLLCDQIFNSIKKKRLCNTFTVINHVYNSSNIKDT